MEPWHLDIRDFIDLKKNSGEERRRAHDLFPAMWLNDIFMERAKKDELWTLFDPYDVPHLHYLYGKEFEAEYLRLEDDPTVRKEIISAKNLWKIILRSYFETGSPFLNFKDTANKANPNDHSGVILSSNLCTEIFQNTAPSEEIVVVTFDNQETINYDPDDIVTTDEGNDLSPSKLTVTDTVNGSRVYCVEKKLVNGDTAVCNLASVNLSKVNTKKDLARVIPIAVRMLDNVIDLNFYPLKKVKDTNTKNRAIGLGVMGEAQLLAENKIYFGTKEHFEFIDEVMENVSYETINASMELSKEKGSYPQFKGSKWSDGIFPIDTANEHALELTERRLSRDWDSLRDEVKINGIRNGYLMAIAPTSSISIVTGTTQTIEPIYKRKWFEENLSGLIPVTAPNLNPDTWEYYTPAYELNQIDIVKAGSVRQKWIDQGQSLNIFITLDKANGKYLNEIYTVAHKFGLKSTYYLRSESPEAKEVDVDIQDRSTECIGCQ